MKDIVIFDLDGTLANTAECRHYLEQEPKNWDAFYYAACSVNPIQSVVDVCRNLQENYSIYIVSGRSDLVKKQTIAWLNEHGIKFNLIFMRPHGDHTPDDILKKSWCDLNHIPIHRVLCAFDDRDRVVKMWRSLGIPCFQVAEGDF